MTNPADAIREADLYGFVDYEPEPDERDEDDDEEDTDSTDD